MTNWKAFKIIEIEEDRVFEWTTFKIKDYGWYWLERKRAGEEANFGVSDFIKCHREAIPFNTCRIGDYLEIDVDRSKVFHEQHKLLDASVARKFGSTAVVSSSSGQMSINREQAESFADRLADRVEQSGGQYELDAYIQQGTEPHGTPYTRQGWVYRKK